MKADIYVEQDGHVAELVLNRPAKLNTMTPAMFKLLRELSQEINQTRSIHVVVLRGEGERAFCAGTDINTLKEYEDFWDWRNRVDYVTQIRAIRQPVIAVLRGWALGGGHELAVASDIRIAARSAVLGSPEIGLGWVGAGGTSQYLPRLIGYGQAMRILLTGQRITAEEALRIGLVEEVVEDDEVLPRARELAKQIASYSPVATQATKAAVRAGMNGNLDLGLQIENELMALCFAAGNDKAGAQLFNARKTP
ncbi:MAG: enoyl-CoA hydratase/isomerase family protein [Chelatococcus sp.]|uniref:enoyl-CoA hydratase/isomerase family protein n=1 Tax=Chelatococcus sp. TaxID=1953771 RepID=UPI0025C1BD37|nr:enoyl-CoA hydratase/isomerase family protein [Chelatococcus sp.]MBX3540304.1 enoyl-CoA hydratase/isomerase family protein [Chelatococcus sp.]